MSESKRERGRVRSTTPSNMPLNMFDVVVDIIAIFFVLNKTQGVPFVLSLVLSLLLVYLVFM